MIKYFSTFISGIFAVGIYVMLVGLLIFYFNTREENKPKHFVKKNDERIRISMSTLSDQPKQQVKKSVKKEVVPNKKPAQTKKVVKKETVQKKKVVKKKVIKEKVVKKPQEIKKTDTKKKPVKKVNKPKSLFDNINIKKQPSKPKQPKITPDKTSASNMVTNSQKKQKHADRGIENAYLARIEEKLKGWPAQSEYAGEKAKVWLKVNASGKFEFKVITASGNEDFNVGLVAYLKQLQIMGFGPHKNNRPYELNVEFIATE